jgi:stage II sporulation protein E
VGAGLLMDMCSGRNPYYCMVYSLAGLCAGLCAKRGKISAVLAFVAGSGAVVLWTWETGMRIAILYELFAAAMLVLPLPASWGRVPVTALAAVPRDKSRFRDWERVRAAAARRMEETARALRELYESLRDTSLPGYGTGEDPAVVFTRAAQRECICCELRETCWQADFQGTQNALNSAGGAMMERGRALAEDFPGHFRGRCIHFSVFLGIVNEEVVAYLLRRQVRGRLREGRAAISRQYEQMDRILRGAAAELSADITPDLPRQTKLQAFLRENGLPDNGAVYYDAGGTLRVETPFAAALQSAEARKKLEILLGTALRDGEALGESALVFTREETFRARAGVAGRNRGGESVSGDAGTWFRREDGLLCILLCDGMGSGADARKESDLAVRLLKNFLKAGVEPETALLTVNAALAVRGAETGACTTVDLLTVELTGGQCAVYKFGAASSYLRKGRQIRAVENSAPPAGISSDETVRPDITRFHAEDGDWILLLSDGLVQGGGDGWLREEFLRYGGTSPGELSALLLQKSPAPEEDDCTVIAVKIERRGRAVDDARGRVDQ